MSGNYDHFYKVGSQPKIAYESSLKPLSDWNVYVIGEAFMFPRLYRESEFSSAEDVLQKLFFHVLAGEYDSIEAISLENRMRIGTSISLSTDGRRLAVVSYGDDSFGNVAVFQYNGDSVVRKWSTNGEVFGTPYSGRVSEDVTVTMHRAAK